LWAGERMEKLKRYRKEINRRTGIKKEREENKGIL
jgi:hypothetical protein